MDAVLVYATAPDLATAERLAQALVGERLAACANLLPGMRSVYRWQGAVETADEVVVLLKTTAERVDALGARLRQLHPYQEPCVMQLPVAGGSPSYLRWIAESVRP